MKNILITAFVTAFISSFLVLYLHQQFPSVSNQVKVIASSSTTQPLSSDLSATDLEAQLEFYKQEIQSLTENQQKLFDTVRHLENKLINQIAATNERLSVNDQMQDGAQLGIASKELTDLDRNQARQRFMEINTLHAMETTDIYWDSEMQENLDKVEERFSQLGFTTTRILQRDCRSSLCKVEFDHGNSEIDEAMLSVLLSAKSAQHVSFDSFIENGVNKTVAIYKR